MHKFFQRLKQWLIYFRGHFSNDRQQNLLYEYFNKNRKGKESFEGVVLVQCVEDPYYFGLFGQIVLKLREQRALRVESFVLRSLNVAESRSIMAFIVRRFMNSLCNRKWTRLYGSFCDGVGYSSTSFNPIYDLLDLYRAWKTWQGLQDKKSLLDLKIDGVSVGDLINDSFLRFKPAPTVDLKDIYALIIIWQTYRDMRRAIAYFSKVHPDIYLTSYSTYIQHGIAVRVALQYGVRVFSFGNYEEFAKALTISDWVHTKCPDEYATEFLRFDCQYERLALAETRLSVRLSGGIDSATAYMKKSAYAETGDHVPEVLGAIVIFLHDFYDSPNVYRTMVFPDFWEWVCFTIEVLHTANIPFFVKPHPNQINLSDTVLDELKARYPGLSMISPSVSNRQLVEAGMLCAVTVYGTIAHEMAYLGVPTIACAHHPHISFDFCKTAQSREEYARLLQDSTSLRMDKDVMRRQSLIFYYMHNLAFAPETSELMETLATYRTACADPEGDQELVPKLHKMSLCTDFKSQVSKFIQ